MKDRFVLEFRYPDGNNQAYTTDGGDITAKEMEHIDALLELWRPEDGYVHDQEIVISLWGEQREPAAVKEAPRMLAILRRTRRWL